MLNLGDMLRRCIVVYLLYFLSASNTGNIVCSKGITRPSSRHTWSSSKHRAAPQQPIFHEKAQHRGQQLPLDEESYVNNEFDRLRRNVNFQGSPSGENRRRSDAVNRFTSDLKSKVVVASSSGTDIHNAMLFALLTTQSKPNLSSYNRHFICFIVTVPVDGKNSIVCVSGATLHFFLYVHVGRHRIRSTSCCHNSFHCWSTILLCSRRCRWLF